MAFGVAAEHARDFADAVVAGYDSGVGGGYAVALCLGNDYVVVSAGGDLCEVRDREYLVAPRDATHGVADLEAHAAADAGVHLIEDQRRDVVQACEYGFEREHQPRELAAGRDASQRPCVVAHVERDLKFHILRAARADLVAPRERYQEAPMRHSQCGEQFTDRARELLRA